MTPTHPSCPPAVPRSSVARRFTGFEALIVLAVCVMLFVLALPAVYAAWGRQHATGQPAGPSPAMVEESPRHPRPDGQPATSPNGGVERTGSLPRSQS